MRKKFFFFLYKFNGYIVTYVTEEKEREKESGSIPAEGGETPAKENGVEDEDKKKKKKKNNKKKKNKKSVEKKKNGEDVADEIEHENDEAVEEELEFWMPPDGERWDFDDGRDRWGSDSDSDVEMNEETDPIGLFTCILHYYCVWYHGSIL